MYGDISRDAVAQHLLEEIIKLNGKVQRANLASFSQTKYTTVDISKVERAISFAKYFHEGQFRKSGEPYITHPIAVAELVAKNHFYTNAICAALLHDVLEDTECTYDIIYNEFGSRIAEIVYRVTRVRDGKKLSVSSIMNEALFNNDIDSLVIKVCDRIHNIQTIEHTDPNKLKAKIEESILIFTLYSEICEMRDLASIGYQQCKQKLEKLSQPNIKQYYSLDYLIPWFKDANF